MVKNGRRGGYKCLTAFLLVTVLTCGIVLTEANVVYANHPDNKIITKHTVNGVKDGQPIFTTNEFTITATPDSIHVSDIIINTVGEGEITGSYITLRRMDNGYGRYRFSSDIVANNTAIMPATKIYEFIRLESWDLITESIRPCILFLEIDIRLDGRSANTGKTSGFIIPPCQSRYRLKKHRTNIYRIRDR